MASSRLSRYEERRQKRRLILALAGSVGLILFLFIFGFKILVGFSLFVDRLRGNPRQAQNTPELIQPPQLDPLPLATNSGKIKVSGRGQTGLTLLVYQNEVEIKKLTLSDDGTFKLADLSLTEGNNTFSAKLIDEKGNISDLSNVVNVTFKKTPPALEVNSPMDNSEVRGETNMITVSGKTSEDATVTVNERLAVVKSDGSFNYNYTLTEGDNLLKIVATDVAGNQTIIERKVIYHR
ncbi:MAG: hypothetical protein ACOY0S_02080 [Patescibacteria group bacterium]